MSKPRIIAFYLPQFHPTPDNDKWWGKGFTEWTNVGKAKPLFRGHYQPHVPADLGYYDLRLPEVREAQAALAKEAGIDGFCYWNYWFGNGKEELERPLNEILALGKPDFPFMLCWANESWHSKLWNKDDSVKKITLLEQQYPGDEDIKAHFYHRLSAFKDHRYIKIENKPVFMIYEWRDHPDIKRFIDIWRALAIKEGFDGIYFIAHVKSQINQNTKQEALTAGFDAINTVRIWSAQAELRKSIFSRIRNKIKVMTGLPRKIEYKKIFPYLFEEMDKEDGVYPTLVPNWDHSPRSGSAGVIFHDCRPEYFKEHCRNVLTNVGKKKEPNIVFIRAWNEWGEGNHMEPDLKYGKGYIKSLREAIGEFHQA